MERPYIHDRKELRDLVVEDFKTNLGKWRSPGFRVLLIYRLTVWCRNIPYRVLRGPVLHLFLYWLWRAKIKYGIDIKETTHIGRRVAFRHQGGIVIHRYARIGDDCIIRQGVSIGSALEWIPGKAPTIGNRVSIGANSTITGNDVVVGDDVFIGPNVTVFFDVPAGSKVVAQRPRVLPPDQTFEDGNASKGAGIRTVDG